MKWVRRLYDWVLHWADTKWGALALFILAFAESSFFPVPPDVLLIALCLGAVASSFRFAAIATIGSVLGGIAGYVLGMFIWGNPVDGYTGFANFFFNDIHLFSVEQFDNMRTLYEKWDFWIVFTAGFTPIPFKLITISSGVFDINFVMFLIASIISRGLRFFLIAWLIWKFGPQIKNFIDKYFNWLALGFTVLLIGGFYVIAKVV